MLGDIELYACMNIAVWLCISVYIYIPAAGYVAPSGNVDWIINYFLITFLLFVFREVLQFLIDNDNDRVAMEIAERYITMIISDVIYSTYNIGLSDWLKYVSSICRGFAHIMDHLDMDDVLCYWKTLLQNYANLTKWTVEKLADSSFLKISA